MPLPYNSVFPATYQPYYGAYQPSYQTPPTAPQNANNGIIWVQGEAGAKSYLVAPNNTVQLWDSESQRIFLKSADASGMPSMKILEYTIFDNAQKSASKAVPSEPDNPVIYATKTDIEALSAQISGLQSQLDTLTGKKPVRKEAPANE